MIDVGLPPIESYWGTITNPEVFVVHWGTGYTPQNAEEERATLFSYDSYHRNSHGWGGIGYNLLVGTATGNVYKGRGFDIIGAHARGWNHNGYGCCVMGEPQEITPAIANGLRAAYREACEYAGRELITSVHRYCPEPKGTVCPGNALTAWVESGGLKTPSQPQTPQLTLEEGEEMLHIYLKDYATGAWKAGSGNLFALVAPGFFCRYTGESQAKRFAGQVGAAVEVTSSMWDALAATAKTGSNSPGYRDNVDADLARIAAGIEKITEGGAQ